MGSRPTLPSKGTVTNETMLNFDGNFDGQATVTLHVDGSLVFTTFTTFHLCKQKPTWNVIWKTENFKKKMCNFT